MYINIASIKNIDWFQKSLYWPVSDEEKRELSINIIEVCKDLLVNETNYFREQIIRGFLSTFVFHCFNTCYAAMVVERMRKYDIPISDYKPSPIDYFSWLLNGSPLEYRIVKSQLLPPTPIKNLLKFGARRLSRPRCKTILLGPNITAKRFLSINKIEVYESRVYEWFSPFMFGLSPSWQHRGLIKKIFEITWERVSHFVRLEKLRRWLFNFIEYNVRFIAQRLVELYNSNMAKTTQKLFTGTQGKIGVRLISLAVLENGGEVITFPHSGGMVGDFPRAWIVEPLTTKKFYCYTPAECQIRMRQMRVLGNKRYASLDILPCGEKNKGAIEYPGPIRSAVFVTSGYTGEIMGATLLPNILRLDFELKIIKELLNSNLDIIVKLHRKSRLLNKHINILEYYFGGRIKFSTKPLTDFLREGSQADAYVLDNISGGSLIELVKTEKPVVLFSPLMYLLAQETRDSFYKRVKVIPCWMDEKNRANFDKEEVKKYFNLEKYAIDFELVNKFTNPLFEY